MSIISLPVWLDNWEAFLDELHSNFGPFDETGNAKHESTNLCMRITNMSPIT